MSIESRLLKAAQAATNDPTISDVAEFEPKGSMGASMAGAAAGSLAGSAATGQNSWGQAIGTAGGLAAGRAAVGISKNLPPFIAVAVSPTTVYLLGMRAAYATKHLDPIAEIDRAALGVEVHQRATVRTVVLEDLETETTFALEVPRLNLCHGKAMVELLMLSEQHHDEEPADPQEA